MLTTGRITPESIGMFEYNFNSLLGFEFAGFDTYGRRIMGICTQGYDYLHITS